jgi:hypothetical protein
MNSPRYDEVVQLVAESRAGDASKPDEEMEPAKR